MEVGMVVDSRIYIEVVSAMDVEITLDKVMAMAKDMVLIMEMGVGLVFVLALAMVMIADMEMVVAIVGMVLWMGVVVDIAMISGLRANMYMSRN